MGDAARRRAVDEFAYDRLVDALCPIAAGDFGALDRLGWKGNIDDRDRP